MKAHLRTILARRAAAPAPWDLRPVLTVASALCASCTSATFDEPSCNRWDGTDPLPPGAEQMLGKYVLQVDTFSIQPFGEAAGIRLDAREHSRVTFVADVQQRGERVHMALRGCSWQGEFAALGLASTAVGALDESASAGSMPERDLRMGFGPGCTWQATADAPTLWGYSEALPATCTTPGAKVAATAEQTWLAGVCTCPDAGIPESPSDCRLTDPDSDGQPGFTFTVQGQEYGTVENYFVLSNQSGLTGGVVDERGHHTARVSHAQTRKLLDCRELSAGSVWRPLRDLFVTSCRESADNRPCPDDTSRVVMRPVDAALSDAEACARAKTTFLGLTANFPASCDLEVRTQ